MVEANSKLNVIQNKCEHLSPMIECNVGGNGTVHCLKEDFHTFCPYKVRHVRTRRNRIRRSASKSVDLAGLEWLK
jgi:hypothetical protein